MLRLFLDLLHIHLLFSRIFPKRSFSSFSSSPTTFLYAGTLNFDRNSLDDDFDRLGDLFPPVLFLIIIVSFVTIKSPWMPSVAQPGVLRFASQWEILFHFLSFLIFCIYTIYTITYFVLF
jgi:hypothetical protein